MTTTRIYLSWSGELGRRASGGLRDALQDLSPRVDVWFTQSDISAGMRWRDEIARATETSNLAVICVTSTGPSPWEIEMTVQNLRLLSEAKGFGEEAPEWLDELVPSLAEARL